MTVMVQILGVNQINMNGRVTQGGRRLENVGGAFNSALCSGRTSTSVVSTSSKI